MPSATGRPAVVGELGSRLDPEPGDDGVGLEHLPAGASQVASTPVSIAVTEAPGQHLDALLAVVVGHERRELGREDARADPGLGEDHRDRRPFMASAAAISEPMKPPPITTKRAPSSASARRRR